MDLLFDDYPNPSYGTSIQIWRIAKSLKNFGHEVHIIASGYKHEKIICEQIHIHYIKQKYPFNIFLNILQQLEFSREASNILLKICPDYIYLRDRGSGFFPSKLRFKSAFTINSPDALDSYKPYAIKYNKLNILLFKYNKFMEIKILDNVNKIISLNNEIKEYYNKKGYDVNVIHGCIDVKEYSNGGDHNFILYAGRIDWNRRVDLLIKSYFDLMHDTDINLKIIGFYLNNKEEISIYRFINKYNLNDRIELLPWLNRNLLNKYISQCSYLVLPSLFEIHGNIILEAMASGKPVITSDTGGGKELVINYLNGFIFNKFNYNELKNYMKILNNNINIRKKMGKEARKYINNLSPDTIAKEYLKIFEV